MFHMVLLALADQASGMAVGQSYERNAARLASGLASRHGAGFAALHVSGPLSQEGGCVLQLPGEEVLARRRAGVEALLREVMPSGLTADVMHAAGFAHLEILKTARILGPDLLVLSELGEAERCRQELSDSQANASLLVARGAPCPVLVVTTGAGAVSGPFERVQVCVDAPDHEPQARRLLCFAARLAAREGAELHVLHILPLSGDQPTPDQEEMVRRIALVRERMAYLCQGLPGAGRFTVSVAEGAVGVETLKHARERKADLIILAPAAENGAIAAARVLEGARCPVLLIGPGVLAAQPQQPVNARKDRTTCPSTSSS